MRRDKRGRRIGRNWWREMIVDAWRCAHDAWEAAREAACNGWATEEAEWAADHPRPTLKSFMVGLAGATT